MRAIFVMGSLLLAGCGGRAANPIALEKPFDSQLSCAHLAGEYENNIKRLEELTGESREKFANNLGLLLVSPLLLDFSDAQKREAEAIVARNKRLTVLMTEKDCPAPSAVSQKSAEQS